MSKSNLFLRSFLAAAFLTIFFLSSCGKNQISYNNAYEFGTDYQYYMTSSAVMNPKIQETESGCVFYHDGFIYNYDKETEKIVPLCSKGNCLHDAETDSEKRKECNAYLDNSDGISISLMLYKDSVYVGYSINLSETEDNDYCVCRISLDGSSRDTLFTSEALIYPIIHRGYLYYYEYQYTVNSDALMDQVIFCRRNIEKKSYKEEILYQPESAHGCTAIQAYGKYVYMTTIRDSGKKIVTSVYDTETEKISDMPGERRVYDAYGGHTFYREDKDDELQTLYICDELGNNAEAILEITEDCSLTYDGKYYYICYSDDLSSLKSLVIYDTDFEMIDLAWVPETDSSEYFSPVGGEKYQYLVFDEEESGNWGLYIWDKDVIGDIDSDYYEQSRICYDDSLNAEYDNNSTVTEGADESAPSTEKKTIDGVEIPATSLDQTVLSSYTEMTEYDLMPVENWTDIEESEEKESAENYNGKSRIMLSDDTIVVVMSCDYSMNNEAGTHEIDVEGDTVVIETPEYIIIGECITKTVKLTAYFLKDDEVYSCCVTYTAQNTEAPDTFLMQLPDGADRFIGASADASFDYRVEYETLEEIENHRPVLSGSFSGKLESVSAGRVHQKHE